MRDTQRVEFLDGLRGIAALQVVGLHYCSAYLPAIALLETTRAPAKWESWFIHSPVFVVIDGYASVYVFFLISGAALTYSFSSQPYAIGVGIGRRLVRLGLPMAASVLLAAFLFSLFPEAHVTAGQLTGSVDWLAAFGPRHVELGPVLKEIIYYGLLTGNAGPQMTLWPPSMIAAWHVPDTSASFNVPLWTLHFEFFGSLLVLLLVAIRSLVGRVWHMAVCLLLLAVLALHPLGLFVIGHLIAPLLTSPRWKVLTRSGPVRGAGFAALICGAALASYRSFPWMSALSTAYMTGVGLPGTLDAGHTQSWLEAILLFSGVVMAAPAQRVLTARLVRWFGRISFSLYLTHFPILFTLTSAIFVAIGGTPVAAVLAVTLGLAVSLVAAAVFEKVADRPAIYLSRRIGRVAAMPGVQIRHNSTPISVMIDK